MKKNGFVSTTLIYTFFIIFLLLMLFLLNSYSSTRYTLDEYRHDIKQTMQEMSIRDLNLYILSWDNSAKEYEITTTIPSDKEFKSNLSYCVNGAKISCNNNDCEITEAKKRDKCYAYFR